MKLANVKPKIYGAIFDCITLISLNTAYDLVLDLTTIIYWPSTVPLPANHTMHDLKCLYVNTKSTKSITKCLSYSPGESMFLHCNLTCRSGMDSGTFKVFFNFHFTDIKINAFGVGVSCRYLYSFVVYLYVNGSGSITSVGEERANLSAVVYL